MQFDSVREKNRDSSGFVLVSTMKNEGPFILEWVAFHRSIGFDQIIVLTNDCIDESPLLLDRLQDLGQVVHIRNSVKSGEKPQLAAYARAEQLREVNEASWLMTLDADEFLNIHVGLGRLSDLIAVSPRATAFLINWRIFGNSGHQCFSPGYVTERFHRAAAQRHGVNLPYKTLFRHVDAYTCKVLPHQPRYPYEDRKSDLLYVDGAGRRLPNYFLDESREEFLQSERGQVSWRFAQINHYNTRSREDYAVKHRRGGGLFIPWDEDENWLTFNRNDCQDSSIANKMPGMHALCKGLLTDSELERRHRRCCELYRHHIDELHGSRSISQDTARIM